MTLTSCSFAARTVLLFLPGFTSFDISNTGNSTFFSDLCFDGSIQINSIKVINRFKRIFIYPYPNKKCGYQKKSAVTLELQSYEWTYDIVPCFMTTRNGMGGAIIEYLMEPVIGKKADTDDRKT